MAKEKTTKLSAALEYYSKLSTDETTSEEARGYAVTAVYYLKRYARYFENKTESERLMNDNRKWTEDEEEKLKAGFQKGYSVERLAKIHHRKNSGIISRLISVGLLQDETASKKRWTEEEEEKLKKEFLSGKSLAKMAKAHNRTIGGINSRLIVLGFIDE